MSRPIKFRAWDKEEKEYYYDVEHTYDFFCSGRGCYAESFGEVLNQPDRFIVEQYTGLKDKNGERIYEGDIVNITAIVNTDDSDMTCIIDTNSIVCWDKEHARWDINDKPEDEDWDYRRRRYFVFVDSEDRENVEVIGNIHENPELLEKGEEYE